MAATQSSTMALAAFRTVTVALPMVPAAAVAFRMETAVFEMSAALFQTVCQLKNLLLTLL
jgi:hypothetical protein